MVTAHADEDKRAMLAALSPRPGRTVVGPRAATASRPPRGLPASPGPPAGPGRSPGPASLACSARPAGLRPRRPGPASATWPTTPTWPAPTWPAPIWPAPIWPAPIWPAPIWPRRSGRRRPGRRRAAGGRDGRRAADRARRAWFRPVGTSRPPPRLDRRLGLVPGLPRAENADAQGFPRRPRSSHLIVCTTTTCWSSARVRAARRRPSPRPSSTGGWRSSSART